MNEKYSLTSQYAQHPSVPSTKTSISYAVFHPTMSAVAVQNSLFVSCESKFFNFRWCHDEVERQQIQRSAIKHSSLQFSAFSYMC